MEYVEIIMQALLLLMLAPLLSGFIKIVKARLQNRRGPKLLQSYYDLAKLLQKDSVFSPTISAIFPVSPYVYFTVTLTAAAMLPLTLFGSASRSFDVFLLIYLLAAGRLFMVLASLDAGSTFGGMGGSREMYLSVLIEPLLLLTLLTVATRSNSTNLLSMAAIAEKTPFSLPYIFAAIAFCIIMIAETGRVPIDNPDTHLELTMIHEGMILEYSGRYLGLIHWAASLKQLIILILFVLFFLPWKFSLFHGWVPTAAWFLLKLFFAAALLGIAETGTNKMRLFRVPGFLAVSGLLSILALVAQ
ncbi:respiratory chain complex I subunit 1 family protein [Acetonema longum]|uniref:Putative formate hydrogenlyase, membrane subunit n=1 Tax=Acetonema longum DSM 6540 TaxID=1009370 RepID=F7NI31_9FIRM|nr:NADH-quinone oxidoreductase subunit H [Acetonema longum]EGO64263.1 putative formate hydrogenlyase, membrane subunit [Acetonema longum DSM 6540]